MKHFHYDARCHQVLWLAAQVISYREGAVPERLEMVLEFVLGYLLIALLLLVF